MAVRWKDGYRGDLSPWLFLQLCFCSVWGRCPAERGGQTQRCAQLSARLSAELCVLICGVTVPHWDALSQYTFYGPWIESFQDCWWDPEFPQLSQMVQSLPGFLDLCLNVCSPSQVLGDVYTEVLEAAHPLHRGPADHKRSVGPLHSSMLRTSYNQGLEGAARAGLEERGQMPSIEEVKVEHKVSVAAFTSRDEKWVGEGREEDTTEERREGERERRLRLKVPVREMVAPG